MNWDEYYMSLAWSVSTKSKDPSTKVGCVIVSANYKPISFGYNGFVAGCNEQFMTFERPYKDMLSIHAEMNALIFAEKSVANGKVYVTHVSCDNCLKHLLQAGIKEIIYEKGDTNGGFITPDRKKVITSLIKATGVIFRNINGKSFLEIEEGI
jgi:dCMP deaminase